MITVLWLTFLILLLGTVLYLFYVSIKSRRAHKQYDAYAREVLSQRFHLKICPVKEEYNGVKDADTLEKVYMVALITVIMLVGIYPAILTDVIKLGISPITGLLGG